jgi:hypothetical protein
MNEENTDLEHAFFGNVQTILWNYLVKLKRFSVPPMKNKAIRGRAVQRYLLKVIENMDLRPPRAAA